MKKILIKSLLPILLGSVLFTACSSKEEVEVKKTETSSGDMYVNPELKGSPKWVRMPYVQGTISDVGSAPQNAGNDFSFQREEAMADARDNLAKQISVKVNNMFKSFKSVTGSGENSTFDKSSEKVSKQIASETLNNTIVKDTWISTSGTFYVLMAVDTAQVSSKIEESVRTSFKDDKAMYQKFLASKAQGELAMDLEKLNK